MRINMTTSLVALGATVSLFFVSLFLNPFAEAVQVPDGARVRAAPDDIIDVTICALEDSYINEGNPDGNYGLSPDLIIGYGMGQNELFARRTLARFDLTFIPPRSIVHSATFEVGQQDADGVNLVDVSLYAVRGAWAENGVTWDNQPEVSPAAAAVTAVDDGVPVIFTWDVQDLVQEWVDGGLENWGLELRGPESGPFWVRAFESRHQGVFCPRLVMEIEPPAEIPTPTPSPTPTPTPTPTPICPFPDGAGDSFNAATPLTPFVETEEYICPNDDVDWWQFNAARGEEIEVFLYDMPADFDLALFRPDGSEAAVSERWGADRSEYIRHQAYQDGAWRVLVRGKGVADWSRHTPYKLRVEEEFTCFYPDEAGNTFASAAPLTPSVPQAGIIEQHEGYICPQGDIDFYRFNVPAGQEVTIAAELTELPADYDMILRRPDTSVATYSNNGGTADESLSFVADAGGQWRVSVYGPLIGGERPYHSLPYKLEVKLTSPADLRVQGLEVTQATQTLASDVSLARDKLTLVRVYVEAHPAVGPLSGVDVALYGWSVQFGQLYPLPGSPLVQTVSGSPPLALHAKRLTANHSVNFYLPQTWLEKGDLHVGAYINPHKAAPETNFNNNTLERRVTLRKVAPLNVGFVSVRAAGLTVTMTNNTQLNDAVAWLRGAFPVGQINVWYHAGGPINGNYNYMDTSSGCGVGWSDLLDDLDDIYDDWENRPGNAFVYGLLDSSVPVGYSGCGQTPGNVAAGLLDNGAGPRLAHELGHNFNRQHAPSDAVPNPDCQIPGNPDSNYPQYADPAGNPYHRASIGEVGINVFTQDTFDPLTRYDFMSYCTPEWVSPYTWNGILKRMPTSLVVPDEQREAVDIPHIVVSGNIRDGQVDLNPFWIKDRPAGSYDGEGSGPYRIELRDAAGGLLFVRYFDIDDPYAYVDRVPGHFREWMPFPAGTARIVIRMGSRVLVRKNVSAHAPAVTLLSPNGGETWSGAGPFTIRWQATDADGDALVAQLAYSADGGETWVPLAVNLQTNRYALNAAALPGSDRALVRVQVSDGVNTGSDTSDQTFRVSGKAPLVFLLWPVDRTRVGIGEPVILQGVATDPEAGPLPADTLSWSSNVDGALGSGSEVVVDALSPGEHVLTLSARDQSGRVGTASVRVYVGTHLYLPLVYGR